MEMINDEVKLWIQEYTEGLISENEFEEGIVAYDRFLTINQTKRDYKKYLYEMYELPDMKKKAHMWDFTNLELFIKTLGLYIEKEHFGEKGFYDLLSIMRKIPADVDISTVDPESYYGLYKYYITMYQFRNKETHESASKVSVRDLHTLIAYTLCCKLDICFTYRKLIEKAYVTKKQSMMFDQMAYCRNLIEKYSNSKYVNLYWQSLLGEEFDAEKLISYNNKSKIIKILGEAGSGKSTLMQHLVCLMAERAAAAERARVPIYVSLADITNVDNLFISRICNDLKVSETDADSLIVRGKITFFLDGYNEILNNEDLLSFAKQLEVFAVQQPDVHIFMSDRAISNGKIPVLKDAYKVYLKPLSLNDKKEFFSRVCQEQKAIDLILEDMEKNPGTYNELDTPLKLQHFLEVVISKGSVSLDWVSDYIDMLIQRELIEKKDQSVNYLKEALTGLALNVDENGRINQYKAQAAITDLCKKLGYTDFNAKAILNLAIDMGILKVIDGEIAFIDDKYLWHFILYSEESGLEGILQNE